MLLGGKGGAQTGCEGGRRSASCGIGALWRKNTTPTPQPQSTLSLGQASVLWEKPAGGGAEVWESGSGNPVVSPPTIRAHARTRPDGFQGHPSSASAASRQGHSPLVGNNHRPQAPGALAAVSQSGDLWFQSHPQKLQPPQLGLPPPAREVSQPRVSSECSRHKTLNLL